MNKTRKALKSLQYSPKGQEIAGIPAKNVDLKVILWFNYINLYIYLKTFLRGKL
jgi:hypothetical protein